MAQRSTHTPLGEYGATTWVAFCKYAHGALKELYAEGQLDFYYITYVCDKNPTGNSHCSGYYNLWGYPTLWWDGGYKVNRGAGSVPAAKNAYTSSINSCLSRSVEDVDINLNVIWIGNTEIKIDISVVNNEPNIYDGTIRVYILELISSMNWKDTANNLYTFPFLDFAFNEAISINPSGTWVDTTTWKGSDYGYSSITKNNTMVVAAVFNDEWHQGYSYPPSSNPFDAYYVDDTVGFRLGVNRPPNIPKSPDPYDGESDLDLNIILSWTCDDPDWFDDLVYDVYFEADDPNPDILVSENQTETTFSPGFLAPETTYYWQIIVEDEHGESTAGPVWHFTTRDNLPPDIPEITGPNIGFFGTPYNFKFKTVDPDKEDVRYIIKWGDLASDTTSFSPSGAVVTVSHTWHIQGTYTITAKAEDINGLFSPEVTKEVTMPRSKISNLNPLLLKLLEQFPIFQQILQTFSFY